MKKLYSKNDFFLHGDAWPKGVVPSADNFQSFWFFLDKHKGVISLIYPLVSIQKNYGKSPWLMGQLTISMAIFHGYVSLPEGNKIKRMEPPSDSVAVVLVDSGGSRNGAQKTKVSHW